MYTDNIPNLVANSIAQQILNKPNSVLLLATGNTMIPIYQELIKFTRNLNISWELVTTFNLDEYWMPDKSTETFRTFMNKYLFDHINIKPENINFLNSKTKLAKINYECEKYERLIQKKGGIDLALVGFGRNNHIAFNEPGSELNSKTRLVKLKKSTIDANLLENTEHALTVGIKTILSAKNILAIATGKHKAQAVMKHLETKHFNPELPSTCLHNYTGNLNYFFDKEALSKTIWCKVNVLQFFKKRILILSPHPDDDVIGAGGLIQTLHDNAEINIAYMTSGTNVTSISSNNGSKKENIRENEAIKSLKVFDNDNSINLKFLNLKGYHTRKIENDDIEKLHNYIKHINPDHIFLAGDHDDPHKTHLLCFQIFEAYWKKYSNPNANLWFYYSIWHELPIHEYDCLILMNDEFLQKKKKSILKHKSQLGNSKVSYFKDEFWEIIIKRNRKYAEFYLDDKIVGIEGFKKIKID